MKNEPLRNDLIDAWLSGHSSPASRRLFARAVVENPETAVALVEQARMETVLRKRFAPSSLAASTRVAMTRQQRPALMRWRWIAAAGGVAAAILIAWPSPKQASQNENRPGITKTPREVRRLGPRDVTPAEQRVTAPTANHSMAARLNQFWLNGSTLHPHIKLSAAVQQLTQSIQQANVLKRPELESLRIEIQRTEGNKEDPDVIF
ncbi:MAG TPA: hypothetical protein VHM91_07610, partial [Verrucomicrobiales bacterium]|nr:hypothetical protein [Verrucomicrobiales bacterium]